MVAMNRKLGFVVATCVALIGFSVFSAAKSKMVKGEMKDAQGKSVGWVMIKPAGQGVEIKLTLKNMPAGEHGVHLHQVAKCDGPDFKSAGPHFNPDSKQHGMQNADGHHAGDLPNFHVSANGKADVTLFDKDANLNPDTDSHSLFANGGTAIVVHAKADDMKTDPSGNSGDRIACGVITH